MEILEELDIDYIDDFWNCFSYYKTYNQISIELFKQLIRQTEFHFQALLKQKHIVHKYGQAIADYLLYMPNSAELLVQNYLQANPLLNALCFPKELTEEQRDEIIKKYITSDNVNPNILKLIAESQHTKEMPLYDKTKLMAKRKYEDFTKNFFHSNTGMKYGVKVAFSKTQKDSIVIDINNDNTYSFTYDLNWVTANQDYPTLLNNFIYLFEYVDRFFRSQFVSNPATLEIFERLVFVKGVKEYPKDTAFRICHDLYNLQMAGYYYVLRELDIKMENIFKWFFEVYLKAEFDADGFVFSVPSDSTTDSEKCKLLAAEIDSILKQFSLFVADGYIDRELLEISSKHIMFCNIPSFMEEKYVYPEGKYSISCMNLLFSDQSSIKYTSKKPSNYNNFYEHIRNEKMTIDDFEEFQKPIIDWLIEQDCLYLLEQGILSIEGSKAILLRDLFYNQVGCSKYLRANAEHSQALDKLINANEVRSMSSLFSEPEQSYLNYILNQAEFSDGYDLRNKYLHGTHSLSVEEHRNDYFELLKIILLIIIKINEEFCLRELDRGFDIK
jgi:hypothetical protein